MSGGTTSKKQFSICCNDLACKLGPDLCKSLPAFHAFTGCDYSASFFGKGKATPFNVFEKNPKIQKVFESLLDPQQIFNKDAIDAVQEFTCLIYKVKNCMSVNEARFRIFDKTFSNKSNDQRFAKKISGFE